MIFLSNPIYKGTSKYTYFSIIRQIQPNYSDILGFASIIGSIFGISRTKTQHIGRNILY